MIPRFGLLLALTALASALSALQAQAEEAPPPRPPTREELERSSPTLRRWIANPPDLLYDIENGQAFPTRLGIGVVYTGSRRSEWAYTVTLSDVILGGTRLSLNADFTRSGTSNQQWGAAARYYLAPLGSYFNGAPQLGYRSLVLEGVSRSGFEAGAKVIFALAPRAADISFSQSWVFSEEGDSVGRAVLEVGYALSPHLRLSASVLWLNSIIRKDTSFGLQVELTGY